MKIFTQSLETLNMYNVLKSISKFIGSYQSKILFVFGIFQFLFRVKQLVFFRNENSSGTGNPPPTAQNGREWVRMGRGGLRSAISPQFPAISAIFRIFPQFSAIFWGYRNFYPWEYLTPQFLLGFRNHNMWFKIHNFCFEHPFFLSKYMKFDHKCAKKYFLLGLAWFGLVKFLAPFSLSSVREPKFFQVQTAISLRKKLQFFCNFPQFSTIFWGVLRPQSPPPGMGENGDSNRDDRWSLPGRLSGSRVKWKK